MSKIYYLGPTGTYSYQVAQKLNPYFSTSLLCPCHTFSDIHQALKNNPRDIAIIPVENSATTNIHENIDFLFDNAVFILAEVFLPIILNVIGFPATQSVKYIHSHPKALQQASIFLKEQHFIPIQSTSTAAAQKEILLLGPEHAALGDFVLDDKLVLLHKNVGNVSNNQTRFIAVSFQNILLKKGNKVSFICKLKHQKGALALLLQALTIHNINLTKIESKLIPQAPFEYLFLIEGIIEKPLQKGTLAQLLSQNTLNYRLLGEYTCL